MDGADRESDETLVALEHFRADAELGLLAQQCVEETDSDDAAGELLLASVLSTLEVDGFVVELAQLAAERVLWREVARDARERTRAHGESEDAQVKARREREAARERERELRDEIADAFDFAVRERAREELGFDAVAVVDEALSDGSREPRIAAEAVEALLDALEERRLAVSGADA